MIVHNGHLLAGTLPLAQIYEYNGGTEWKLLKRLDWTPDSKYRRVWTMAEYQGRVFASTLPSGRIYALEIGHNVTADTPLSPGPHLIAAQKQGGRLTLFVDGQRVAQSPPIAEGILLGRDLRNWKAGPGMNEPFRGQVTNLDILPSP